MYIDSNDVILEFHIYADADDVISVDDNKAENNLNTEFDDKKIRRIEWRNNKLNYKTKIRY